MPPQEISRVTSHAKVGTGSFDQVALAGLTELIHHSLSDWLCVLSQTESKSYRNYQKRSSVTLVRERRLSADDALHSRGIARYPLFARQRFSFPPLTKTISVTSL